MSHPKELSIADFTYHLPDERIAYNPLPERDASRLLVYRQGMIEENIYRNIGAYIPEGALMVFNNTKVMEARILFQKPSGGTIEVFCLEPHEQYPDITTAMTCKNEVLWLCLVGGASKWKAGMVLQKEIPTATGPLVLEARYMEKRSDCFVIAMQWNLNCSFAEVLHLAGNMPLPPYIKRAVEPADQERYQTVFAHHDGSVAAPTAGLHFTPEILQSLRSKNIAAGFVTLHVGAGTFKPVKAATMADHDMHGEYIVVTRELIQSLLNHDGPVVAVGTTSLRTLESLYWFGVALCNNRNAFDAQLPSLEQWAPYNLQQKKYNTAEALQALISYLNDHGKNELIAKTQIIIAPGYDFKIVKGLVTNFHQPSSTLLLLVAALVGDSWKHIYEYALQNNFRFLSYGDGCLLWNDYTLV